MLDHGFRGSSPLSPKQGYGKQNTMMGKTLRSKLLTLWSLGSRNWGQGRQSSKDTFLDGFFKIGLTAHSSGTFQKSI